MEREMNKLFVTIIGMLFLLAASLPAFGANKYGKPITLEETTRISDIEKNPKSFIGKKVLVKGTVVEVCAKRGCWLDIASDTPFEKIQIKVTDGVIVFPMSARGHNALVEGVVEELQFSKKDAIAYHRHKAEEKGLKFDASSITGPENIYRIRALGAVVE